MTGNQRPFVTDDLYRLRIAADVSISGDGTQAAIVVTFADRDKDEYRSAVALVDLASGGLRYCTDEQKKSWCARFSPDGKTLAVLSDRSGTAQIWTLRLDGGEPVQRTRFKRGASDPQWSPDGRRIAFLSPGGEPELTEEQKKEEKPQVKVVKRVRYREDGRGYFHDAPNHVFVVDVESGNISQVTDGDDDDASEVWSADGTQIAFLSNRTGDPGTDAVDVWVVASTGGQCRRLTPSTQTMGALAWSPDGARLAVLGSPHVQDAGGRSARVGFVSAGGGAVDFVTDADAVNYSCAVIGPVRMLWFPAPLWTAHGVVAIAQQGGRLQLDSVKPNGKATALTSGDQTVYAFDVSRDGSTIAFVASRQDDPANLYVIRDSRPPQRVTDLNAWLGSIQQPSIERFEVKQDGAAIEAWLVNPADRPREERLPLLLLIHGGPHAAYGHAWMRGALAYAARGYRVLYANPRGSTGYGEEFACIIHPGTGDLDQRDLLAAVDAAAERGGVDEHRLGVTGGSYGGFMTNLMLGRTDRFAAGVTLCCISNWKSFYGTCDYGWTMAWEFGDEPWVNDRYFVSQSPLTYAANINVPLLILHGEDDLRCPIEQAEQIFTVLQRRGIRSEMRRYPGEPHAIGSKRPSFQIDVIESTLNWFDKHLRVPQEEARHPEPVRAK